MELKNKEVSQQQQQPQHIQLGITRLAIVKHTTLLHKIWYLVSLTIWNYKMLYTHTHTYTYNAFHILPTNVKLVVWTLHDINNLKLHQ